MSKATKAVQSRALPYHIYSHRLAAEGRGAAASDRRSPMLRHKVGEEELVRPNYDADAGDGFRSSVPEIASGNLFARVGTAVEDSVLLLSPPPKPQFLLGF